MAHQGTILQLVEAHWGALDGLSCFTVVASTCKVQTLPTNLNIITAPNTHLHTHLIAQVFAKTINGKFLAPPGICQLYLFKYNRCLKQTGNRQYPTAFTMYPDLKFMLRDSVVVYNFCMLLSWSLDFILVSIYTMTCNIKTIPCSLLSGVGSSCSASHG